MKRKYIYGSFLVAALAVGAYLQGYDYIVQKEQEVTVEDTETDENNASLERLLQVDTNNELKTTNTTKYILEYYNSKEFTLREESLPIPGDFAGLSREELIEKIQEYENNPNADDVNQGFVKFELVSFSKNAIVLRKTYYPYEEKNEYLLKANGIYVSVFYYETDELYENTTIRLENLPSDVRDRISKGEYITNIRGLYDFLENYSS